MRYLPFETSKPFFQRFVYIVAASVGGLAVILVARKVFRYMRHVQTNHGTVYEYKEEFQQEEHTHFTRIDEVEGTGEKELKILRGFVRNEVIPNFREHHSEGTQHFAVLVLLEESISSLAENWCFQPLTSTGRPYVDPRHNTRPPRHLYGNYIVAHPELRTAYRILRKLLLNKLPRYKYYYDHAEEMLTSEFDAIRSRFEADRRRKTKCVILFSWLFPCDRCIGKIIKKFGQDFRDKNPTVQRVVVTFAIYWRRIPFEQNWRNFERLKENGFDVVRVKYTS